LEESEILKFFIDVPSILGVNMTDEALCGGTGSRHAVFSADNAAVLHSKRGKYLWL
jgi:hypothetical protein